MIAGISYYKILWYFLLYSFLGWAVEVAYHALTQGKVVNRGFLNGPVCPIYGVGMVGVLLFSNMLTGAEDLDIFRLFILGAVFSTLAELIVGRALDKLFHTRWWDYSKMPLNFHGYICLAFSIIWGVGVVFAVKIIHPMVANLTIAALPEKYGWPILAVSYAAFAADLVVTVLAIRGMNSDLKELDEIRRLMRTPSDNISKMIAEGTLKASARVEEAKLHAALGRADFKDASEAYRAERERRYNEILGRNPWLRNRLITAFPNARHRDYDEMLSLMRERIRERREKI